MQHKLSLCLEPEIALDENLLSQEIKEQFPSVSEEDLIFRKVRQSIDARNRKVQVNIDVEVFINETPPPLSDFKKNYRDVSHAPTAVIVGAGPAGLFAALRLIELGIKPIVLERGKDVRARRRDLAAINKNHVVNPESNYCFGEGGAGTYSDGKLYTRSKKRGDIRRVLEILVAHGATEQILIDAHPHIGTNKLPSVVTALRESILQAGGEVYFDTRVSDFIIEKGEIRGVETANGKTFLGLGVILATGHSARDIFQLCQKRNVLIEPKSFAMGVRIEHQQNLIDQCQYHRPERGLLPAASYSLVAQTQYQGVQRGVFSFCMCPGGFIVPSATAEGEIVVNGMSPSRRDSKFANSGLVVAINEPDWKTYQNFGALAGLELQKSVEQAAWQAAKKDSEQSQFAPAQLVQDFIQHKTSKNLLETSYQPSLASVNLHDSLPDFIAKPLKQALKEFGQKMRGYASNEAQLIGVESRTSSPVRVLRGKEDLEHVQIKRFFPCGEGAGYAGGIVSAAMDGERCAEKLVEKYV